MIKDSKFLHYNVNIIFLLINIYEVAIYRVPEHSWLFFHLDMFRYTVHSSKEGNDKSLFVIDVKKLETAFLTFLFSLCF